MKKICAYMVSSIFALMPIIILVAYFTYTEKIVAPILMVVLTLCFIKLRKEK